MLFRWCKQTAAGASYQIAAEWKSALFETFSYEGVAKEHEFTHRARFSTQQLRLFRAS